MSNHLKIICHSLITGIIITLLIFILGCEGPTGGDFKRPTVSILNIGQSEETIDDTLFFSKEIELTAEDNEELDRVELYIFNTDPADTTRMMPVQTFTGDPPYSYNWVIDTSVASGEYKILAGVWDKVGYYYQEFRTVLLRGTLEDHSATIGALTDVSGAPLNGAYVSLITSNNDTLAKNADVSSSGGNYAIASIPVTESDTSVFAKANYLTSDEQYTLYSSQEIGMEVRNTYVVDFGISDSDENYDYLKISNISHSTTQIVEFDTLTQMSDSVTFQFDYEAWVSGINTIAPNKDAWLVISADNNDFSDSTSMAINLGDIGFKPGDSGTVNFTIYAPQGSFSNDVFTIYGALIDYATSESDAFSIYRLFYFEEQRILRIGKIKVQWI